MWLESLGVLSARALVDVPPNDALEHGRARRNAVRHEDVLLGFVWVVVGDRPLADGERAALERVASAAQELLWERRDAARRGAAPGAHAAARRRRGGRRPRRAGAAHARRTARRGCRRRGRRGRRASASRSGVGDRSAGILVVAATTPRALADALSGAPRVAAAAAPNLRDARDGLRHARLARLAQLAEPASAPPSPSSSSAPGAGHRPLGPGRAPARARAGAALAEHRHGDELIEAVEAVLEAGGDVAAAADALHVHRATLYRRLQRAQEASGLDLRRGDDRLLAQLGLRIWRLRQLSHPRS